MSAYAANALKNCATSYASRCLFSHTHLIMVQHKDGHIASLAEIKIEQDQDGSWRLTVAQHRGRFNKEPSIECGKTLDAWVRAIASGQLSVDFDGLDAALAERIMQRKRIGEQMNTVTAARERFALRQVGL